MGGLGKAVVQGRMTGEDEAKGTLAIEIGDREQANVLEGVVGHDMNLIEHEQVFTFVLEEHLGDGERGLRARTARDDPRLARKDVDEPERPDGRVREVVHDVAPLLQLIGELAEQEALAATRLRDQRGDAVDLDGEA